MKSSFAIAALVAATLGLGSVLPALAQDAVPTAARQGQNGPRHLAPDRGMGPAGLLMLACTDKGAEALEIGLVRMAHRLNLTADQQKLFETFRTKALTTETSFADTCKASRPAIADGTRPDLLARLKAHVAIDRARLTALTAVLPDFEALYASLSDQQKADLMPHHGRGMGNGIGRWGNHDRMGGPDRYAPPAAAPQNS